MNSLVCKIKYFKKIIVNINQISARNMASEWGSGAGKGGGEGGPIRTAGGAFGKLEAAREEEYFRRKQREELEKLRKALEAQKQAIEKQIKEHDTELERLSKIKE